MSRPISTEGGAVTVALSVATLTEAVTSGISQSFFSTRAAHAAHVMPRIESSTSLDSGADVLLVTAADDIHPCFPLQPHHRSLRDRMTQYSRTTVSSRCERLIME